MREIVERLDASGRRLQLILISGRNEKLRSALAGMRTRVKTHVVGFTNEVPRYMQAADFFIGKPGPGSVSEAIHLGLPVITTKNSWTLPQERFNADWLEETGAGLKLDSFDQIAGAVGRMLERGELDRMRAAAARQDFRAVWEIPDILEKILAGSASGRSQQSG
jgi:1,2-diacylglycerol 3-beta-galactosyltransferase